MLIRWVKKRSKLFILFPSLFPYFLPTSLSHFFPFLLLFISIGIRSAGSKKKSNYLSSFSPISSILLTSLSHFSPFLLLFISIGIRVHMPSLRWHTMCIDRRIARVPRNAKKNIPSVISCRLSCLRHVFGDDMRAQEHAKI